MSESLGCINPVHLYMHMKCCAKKYHVPYTVILYPRCACVHTAHIIDGCFTHFKHFLTPPLDTHERARLKTRCG